MRNSMRVSLVVGLGALVWCAAAATAAQASIHACVKPKSGATRIVKAKAKCRRGERKLSWSTAGPRGPAGANGANGANGAAGGEGRAGANGVAYVYAISQSLAEPKALSTSGTVVLKKVLPPGSFAAIAKTTIVAEAAKAATVDVFCDLFDVPGTTGEGEGELLDLSSWEGPLGEKAAAEFVGETSITLAGTVTSGVTSTLTMTCLNVSGQSMKSAIAQMQAITVASIR